MEILRSRRDSRGCRLEAAGGKSERALGSTAVPHVCVRGRCRAVRAVVAIAMLWLEQYTVAFAEPVVAPAYRGPRRGETSLLFSPPRPPSRPSTRMVPQRETRTAPPVAGGHLDGAVRDRWQRPILPIQELTEGVS